MQQKENKLKNTRARHNDSLASEVIYGIQMKSNNFHCC